MKAMCVTVARPIYILAVFLSFMIYAPAYAKSSVSLQIYPHQMKISKNLIFAAQINKRDRLRCIKSYTVRAVPKDILAYEFVALKADGSEEIFPVLEAENQSINWKVYANGLDIRISRKHEYDLREVKLLISFFTCPEAEGR